MISAGKNWVIGIVLGVTSGVTFGNVRYLSTYNQYFLYIIRVPQGSPINYENNLGRSDLQPKSFRFEQWGAAKALPHCQALRPFSRRDLVPRDNRTSGLYLRSNS